jgi:hypothetical protein
MNKEGSQGERSCTADWMDWHSVLFSQRRETEELECEYPLFPTVYIPPTLYQCVNVLSDHRCMHVDVKVIST